eukprot:TRINITY_DN28183_c0_g1_i1.p1 TRINITY_DN28183_c0_g1~~TRINITY_DN28183_c0_g1_i1.p1  ORF type:complete len:131 (-),score=10.77 TRINITY_DN28183_c0_g1_i1:73-465(-)
MYMSGKNSHRQLKLEAGRALDSLPHKEILQGDSHEGVSLPNSMTLLLSVSLARFLRSDKITGITRSSHCDKSSSTVWQSSLSPKMKHSSSGTWGSAVMPRMPALTDEDLRLERMPLDMFQGLSLRKTPRS